ncbi:hypothetical protein LTR64_008040 [Lithohypha guttulata]|uniref:uncharacterized protein n=1 Tax=Lithohypha guttulata TaxID=1690604 RepID=UPI002DDF064D|nr:hypothetical protein LTR51_008090 [Lithohypha guttulata]
MKEQHMLARSDTQSQDSDKTLSLQHEQVSYWRLLSPRGVVTDRILHEHYEGEGTEEHPYTISFLENDPGDPKELPQWRKWVIVAACSLWAFMTAMGSSIWIGILREVQEYTQTSREVAILGVSFYVLGFVIGPLFWAPLAESLGRQATMLASYIGFVVFLGGVVAAQNIETMIVLRFLAGCFSSCSFTTAQGILADIFEPAKRGLAFGFYAATPFLGPVLGPMAGGFLGVALGWRWTLGILTLLAASGLVLGLLFVPETLGELLLDRRARTMSKMTGKCYVSQLHLQKGSVSAKVAFKKALTRPWVILFTEPIVLLLSLWVASIYGTLYLFLAGYPYVYQDARGWSPGIGGLALLGIGVGCLVACIVNVPISKRFVVKVKKEQAHPEVRLQPSMVGAVLVPIGILWFAFTNGPSIPWPCSVIAGSFFGCGMVLIWTSSSNYIVDAYKMYAASAIAGQIVMRSVFGAVFPLFTGYIYEGIGIHWASAVPGFLAILLLPLPFLFHRYGRVIRSRSKFADKADADDEALRSRKGSV